MECKICSNNQLEKIKLKDIYYYCQECEAIFINENVILDPDEEKMIYEEHENSPENKGYVKMFERFIKKVIDPYLEDGEVLDFGCGPGPVLAELIKAKGFSVDIYDPYFFPEKVYSGKKYDLITSTEVFEHLAEPVKEINMLLKHLKKGGYLAVMTSFHPGASEFKKWWYHRDPTHITFYNSRTFREISKRFPLKIVFEDGEKYCLFKKE